MRAFRYFFLLSFFLLCGHAYAQMVQSIDIVGNSRLTRDIILSYSNLRIGGEYTDALVSQTTKKLYASGLFSEVLVDMPVSGRVLITVKENPLINDLYFEGNNAFEDDVFTGEITSAPRTPLSVNRVQADVQRILDLYRRGGYFSATVSAQILPLSYNRADVVFEINEGERTKIADISFFGNTVFSDVVIASIVTSQPTSLFFGFFSSGDSYDGDRIQYDGELLRRSYADIGYLDFALTSVNAFDSLDYRYIYLAYIMDEGQRYRYGNVDVRVQHPELPVEPFKRALNLEPGAYFSQKAVDSLVPKLASIANQMGFPFVEVVPRVVPNKDTGDADVVFIISETPKRFVGKISFTGNVRTYDNVMRRVLTIMEGSPLDGVKLERSKSKVYGLAYFSNVQEQTFPSSEALDKVDVIFNVEERPTGSVNAGAGYSTEDGASIELGYNEDNFGGSGIRLSAQIRLAQKNNSVSFSITQPYVADTNLTSTFSIYHSKNTSSGNDYDSVRTGVSYGFSYMLTEYLNQSWSYSIRQESISNVSSYTSPSIKAEEGTQYASTIQQGLGYDRRNNPVYPSAGYFVTWSIEYAGLNGATWDDFKNYVRNNVRFAYYYSVFHPDLVLSAKLQYGNITGVNGYQIGIFDRYFLGSPSLRGFASSGVGPRAINPYTGSAMGGDSIGGNNLYKGTLQLDFPVPGVSNYGMLLHVFLDAGLVTGVDPQYSNDVVDSHKIRSSIGFGFLWRSPMGPIGFDWGFPITKEDYDQTQVFYLNIGTTF